MWRDDFWPTKPQKKIKITTMLHWYFEDKLLYKESEQLFWDFLNLEIISVSSNMAVHRRLCSGLKDQRILKKVWINFLCLSFLDCTCILAPQNTKDTNENESSSDSLHHPFYKYSDLGWSIHARIWEIHRFLTTINQFKNVAQQNNIF